MVNRIHIFNIKLGVEHSLRHISISKSIERTIQNRRNHQTNDKFLSNITHENLIKIDFVEMEFHPSYRIDNNNKKKLLYNAIKIHAMSTNVRANVTSNLW